MSPYDITVVVCDSRPITHLCPHFSSEFIQFSKSVFKMCFVSTNRQCLRTKDKYNILFTVNTSYELKIYTNAHRKYCDIGGGGGWILIHHNFPNLKYKDFVVVHNYRPIYPVLTHCILNIALTLVSHLI